jgi:hypothetical protein
MGVQVVRNIILRTPSERRAQHARILLERSRKLLQENLANTFVGVKHPNWVLPINRPASVPRNKRSVLNWPFYPCVQKFIGAEAMELFWAEKIGELESNPTRQCRVCGKTLKLVRTVFYPDRDAAVRVFECECGERIWDE